MTLAGIMICFLDESPPLIKLDFSGFCGEKDPELGLDILESLERSQITGLSKLDLSGNEAWWTDKDCVDLREKFRKR